MFLLVLCSALNAAGGEQPANNAADPADRSRVLSRKLDSLKAEQEFLRFQKVLYETDSKYLVLDLGAGTGMMMYRNRVLRTFNLERMSKRAKDPQRGVITMTGKIDGSSKKRSLIFGSALALHSRKADAGHLKQPGYKLETRDLAALFYALETGCMAFVK